MRRCCTAVALLACYVLATDAASQTLSCMSGVPCGGMCAPLGGTCINNQCYDSMGYPTMCYSPMAGPINSGFAGGASWWPPLFNPFFSFRPWQPVMQQPMQQPIMQPMVFPELNDCGGKGPCPAGAFCDATGVCREDTCENQFRFNCPKDTGSFQRVNCLHNSGFNRCYESTSGGFKCSKGPAGGSVACASSGFRSSSSSMTQNFDNGGAAGSVIATGYMTSSSSSSSVPPEQVGNANAADAVAAGSSAAGAGAGATAGAGQQQNRRPRGQRAAKAAAAATTATEAPGNAATKQFITQGATGNEQVTVSPDGQTVTVTNVANDGSATATGSASGEQQSVTTMTIPGGSSVTSTSFSGPGTGPATATATSSSSGDQPLYMPSQGGAANAANAAWIGPMDQPGYTATSFGNPAAAAAGGNSVISSSQQRMVTGAASSGDVSCYGLKAVWTGVLTVIAVVIVSVLL